MYAGHSDPVKATQCSIHIKVIHQVLDICLESSGDKFIAILEMQSFSFHVCLALPPPTYHARLCEVSHCVARSLSLSSLMSRFGIVLERPFVFTLCHL